MESISTQVGPGTLYSLGCKLVLAGMPWLVKGRPGVGKTDIIKRVGEDTKHNTIISHPVVSNPTDYKGLPALVKNGAEFIPIGDLAKLLKAKEPTLFYLDDLGQAPPLTQAACMQLLLAREINGKKIPDCVTFVAATNRKEDRAGVTSVLEPVKSRFATILELETNKDDWCEWAMANDMPEALVGFVSYKPDILYAFQPTADVVNSPSPRTLASCGRLMNLGLDDQELVPALAGAIGDGGAAELYGFMKLGNQMPDPDLALDDPQAFKMPNVDAAINYAFCVAIAYRAVRKNMSAVVDVLSQLRIEYQAMAINMIVKREPACRKTKAYIEWQSRNSHMFL